MADQKTATRRRDEPGQTGRSGADIGVIGLSVMGANLALNIASRGHRVAVFNRTPERTRHLMENAGDLAGNLIPSETLADLVRSIRPPRPVLLMIKAGQPVDDQIATLAPLLDPGDIIMDGGNADFHDTRRRDAALRERGLNFLGVGVSGGAEGARHGPSMMVGGSADAWTRVEPMLMAAAATHEGVPCIDRLGPDGAGHFVKMVHNGIEYADMQMIAEIYGILRDGLHLPAPEIGALFERWNAGLLRSFLVEITATVLKTADPRSGAPMVDVIRDVAGQKFTGRWTVIEAQRLAVPAPGIEAAVGARSLSALKEAREEVERQLGLPDGATPAIPDRDAFIADLHDAMLAAKASAYVQGFAIMDKASRDYGWDLPMASIARIWRAGCIIRCDLLDRIAAVADTPEARISLMLTPTFSDIITRTDRALRNVVGVAIRAGLPAPGLMSALAYFDGYRRARGTANLIQAQRDFFGSHGFDRIDGVDEHHGPWAGAFRGS